MVVVVDVVVRPTSTSISISVVVVGEIVVVVVSGGIVVVVSSPSFIQFAFLTNLPFASFSFKVF